MKPAVLLTSLVAITYLGQPAICLGAVSLVEHGTATHDRPTKLAKTAVEVSAIAKAITVGIITPNGNGSGILLQKQGDVYTILTAAHVVKDSRASYTILVPGGSSYQLIAGSIRRYQGDEDLAVLKFLSFSSYKLAELGDSNKLQRDMELYVAGFPRTTPGISTSYFEVQPGQVVANSKRASKNGYGLVYSNNTFPGLSGGPLLAADGKVVGIHGPGDREQNRQTRTMGAKTGFNVGIPIGRFAEIAQSLGVDLDGRVARIAKDNTQTADDYFVTANQKYDQQNYHGALADYDRVIALNPNFAEAYNNRGILKYERFNDPQGALADYNKSISLKPNYVLAHYNRALLKDDLNDHQGALADYGRSIFLNPYPYNADAHYKRGNLKKNKLNDPEGALEDYDRSILQNPRYGDVYYNRGLLKANELNRIPGAIGDFRIAASTFRANGQPQNRQLALDRLRELGAIENPGQTHRLQYP
jgi:tetratricopeptide (TPR) repeat protein